MLSAEFNSGDLDEWRRIWNGRALPYLRSLELVAGPGLLADRLPGGTLLQLASETRAAASVTTAGYNSYFKLTLMNTGGAYTVTVADGATGGASTAVVNGYTTYSLAPYTETVSADRLFYLKYTPAVISGGAVTSAAAMEIGSTDDMVLPAAGVDGCFYTQLGRALFSGGAATVVQDHTAGVANVHWFVSCTAN